MKYTKKRSAVILENLGIVFLVSFAVYPSYWLFRGIVLILGILLIKDQIVNRNYHLILDEEGIKEIKGNSLRSIPYEGITFITISRKFKKYIMVGNMQEMLTIRNTVEGRKDLIEKLIKKTRHNPDIYVDRHVPVILDKY
ncbi:MAG: hypothetical protein AVO33_10430 [delta proteobacterium ML8_F1]|nr:MAG: hypothetical protein AVO33_10430 [delta proteobacterium ML8_F1]